MNCPKCNGYMPVVDTGNTGDTVYRKRKCEICGAVVFTEERAEEGRRAQMGLGHTRYIARKNREKKGAVAG